MYDPTEWVGDFWFGYVCRHCRTDYMRGSPLIERLNPLRYEIGLGRKRPCRIVINRKGRWARKWSDFNWWLWKRRYRRFRGGQS